MEIIVTRSGVLLLNKQRIMNQIFIIANCTKYIITNIGVLVQIKRFILKNPGKKRNPKNKKEAEKIKSLRLPSVGI
jgi:hypothetical protein